jgi:hypothetical protein
MTPTPEDIVFCKQNGTAVDDDDDDDDNILAEILPTKVGNGCFSGEPTT